jgi:hypothetical protein
MNEKEIKNPKPEEQKDETRFWQDVKYEKEKNESDR